jgi:hypothetical protein
MGTSHHSKVVGVFEEGNSLAGVLPYYNLCVNSISSEPTNSQPSNGTRLAVCRLGINAIDAEIVVGQHVGKRVSFLKYPYVLRMMICSRFALRGSSFRLD